MWLPGPAKPMDPSTADRLLRPVGCAGWSLPPLTVHTPPPGSPGTLVRSRSDSDAAARCLAAAATSHHLAQGKEQAQLARRDPCPQPPPPLAGPPRASLWPCPLCTPPAPRQALHSWPGLAAGSPIPGLGLNLPLWVRPRLRSPEGTLRQAATDGSVFGKGGFPSGGAFSISIPAGADGVGTCRGPGGGCARRGRESVGAPTCRASSGEGLAGLSAGLTGEAGSFRELGSVSHSCVLTAHC